jgi:predicted Zn finger-like uncharacterized protein
LVIRCEHCSTLYELDESLLAPEGSPVQCTRCQHIFTAHPARAPGPPVADPPRREVVAEGIAADPRASDASQGRQEDETPEPPPVEARPALTPDTPKGSGPVRPAPPRSGPSVYRPAPSQATVSRPPIIRQNPVGAFESRLRWNARWRWLAPTLIVLTAALAVASWIVLGRRADPAAQARAEALALLALDDAESLDRAASALDRTLRLAPGLAEAAADRALVDAMRARALSDDAEASAARAAARAAERDHLRAAAGPDGEAPGLPEGDDEVEELESRARSLRARAAELAAAAGETLRGLEREERAPVEVARALASVAALEGDRAELQRQVATTAGDPWASLAAASADACSPDQSVRERGVVALRLFVTRHPGVLHARWRLAKVLASLGRREEALESVAGLLGANSRHERGVALRAELKQPPPAPPPAVEAAAAAPPPPPAPAKAKLVVPSRKPLAQPAPPATTANASLSPGPGIAPPPPALGGEGPTPEGDGARAPSPPAPPAPVPPRLKPAAVPEAELVTGGG